MINMVKVAMKSSQVNNMHWKEGSKEEWQEKGRNRENLIE